MRKTNEEAWKAAEEILEFIEKKTLNPDEQQQIVDDSIYIAFATSTFVHRKRRREKERRLEKRRPKNAPITEAQGAPDVFFLSSFFTRFPQTIKRMSIHQV